VLIVDCDSAVARTLDLLFRRSSCECKTAASGEEAITLAETWVPDTVVMDFILSRTLGLDAAYALRARYPECRILMTYAQVSPDLVKQTEDDGFLVFKKPIPPPILLHAAGVLSKGGTEAATEKPAG
jgi:CheY-like chemotaxis protein